MTGPEVIGPRNQSKHLAKLYARRAEKELLRRDDREQNFLTGEKVTALFFLSMAAVATGSGLIFDGLLLWQRLSIGAMGLALLIVQHGMRRNFYKRINEPLLAAEKRKQHVDDSRI